MDITYTYIYINFRYEPWNILTKYLSNKDKPRLKIGIQTLRLTSIVNIIRIIENFDNLLN
jgi:hypothetical protein